MCTRIVNVDPPCLQGTCTCLPGFIPDPELGWLCVIGKYTKSLKEKIRNFNLIILPFSKVVKRKVGDQCNSQGETPGVQYPDASQCVNGTIRCLPKHSVGQDGECHRSNFEGWIDSPCNEDAECEGELYCIGGRCSCASAYKWVALGKGRCASKEIGDACQANSDCASASAGGAPSACRNNMCACPDSTSAITINEFDDTADDFITQKITCVAVSSGINQTAGFHCGLDRSSLLCKQPLVCFKCLEDQFPFGQGICRNVRSTAVIPTLPPSVPAVRQYNTVGKMCRRNSDCSRNEMCDIARFIDPPCQTGTCKCRPCYTVSAQSSQCELANYHIVGDKCTIGDRSSYYPPNAECNNGIVMCKRHFSPAPVGGCVRSLLNGYYGAPCYTRADCDHGLTCGIMTKKCTCPSSYMKWDGEKERCVKREFGDPCSADGDCTVHGNYREGYTYYGGACNANDGRCVCARGYLQTSASFVDLAQGQYNKRTICVQHPSNINVFRGGTCQIDPVFSSDSRIYVCQENSICHHCPEDRDFASATSNIGKCRTLIDVPPSPRNLNIHVFFFN